MKRLGHGEKRLDLVAEVIERHADVVALEEVMTREGVDELMKHLPAWEATVSPAPVGRKGYEEHYAVLVRRGTATVTRSFTMADPRDELAREPFVVCLDARSFDFCLSAFHATFKGGARARDDELEALALLTMDLRDETAEKDWIVVGDFNRPDRAAGFAQFHDAGWRCVLDATPTSIGKTQYANSYDHILIDARHTTEYAGGAARFDLVAVTCTDDFAWCHDEVSDHAPVFATFTTSGRDDD